jgi:hypothetical protein
MFSENAQKRVYINFWKHRVQANLIADAHVNAIWRALSCPYITKHAACLVFVGHQPRVGLQNHISCYFPLFCTSCVFASHSGCCDVELSRSFRSRKPPLVWRRGLNTNPHSSGMPHLHPRLPGVLQHNTECMLLVFVPLPHADACSALLCSCKTLGVC